MKFRRSHTRRYGPLPEQLLSVDDGLDKRKAFIYVRMEYQNDVVFVE